MRPATAGWWALGAHPDRPVAFTHFRGLGAWCVGRDRATPSPAVVEGDVIDGYGPPPPVRACRDALHRGYRIVGM
jgi:hypothetical protein